MRLAPTHYTGRAEPALAKKKRASIAHVLPPLKGLSLTTNHLPGDPLTATILVNMTVENDRLKCRAGYRKMATRGTAPIWHLIPWYGIPTALLAASNNELWNAQNGALVKGAFTGNDWHWTAFSNLSAVDYTVMVNGVDGVWSWDGTLAAAGIVKETVTAPVAETWIIPNNFHLVLAHMNRLWFADTTNLAVYYLPLQTKSGEVKVVPLNAVFRRGGSIRSIHTWTVDGGAGIEDQLVIFSSNGECVIYSGTDPDGPDFGLRGIFRFDAPMSKHSVANWGGDLYVLISSGLVPMSSLLKAETEHIGEQVMDAGLVSLFLKDAITYRAAQGWQTFLNPSTGRMFCNIPQGAPNRYKQMIRQMSKDVWSTFEDVPARCWGWIDPYVYFGDDTGNVFQMHPAYFNDDGQPIRIDVQTAWSDFGTPAKKHFKVVQTYMTSDGEPRPVVDMKVNYDYTPGINIPDITMASGGALWDVAIWDVDGWNTASTSQTLWNGVGRLGHTGAIRLSAAVMSGVFEINGFDVVFEEGVFGP